MVCLAVQYVSTQVFTLSHTPTLQVGPAKRKLGVFLLHLLMDVVVFTSNVLLQMGKLQSTSHRLALISIYNVFVMATL